MTGADYEVVVVNPSNGRTQRWDVYPSREAADAVRLKLAVVGLYALVRRIETGGPDAA